jgi:cell wall-associated NlpC family hydrolase
VPEPSPVEEVVNYALAQRGRPYRKGAAGPSAFDCSGLTSAAYATIGVDLPRYSVTQAGLGRAVDWRHEPIEPGDLVFTRGDNPVIDLGHVGLAVSATEWVVASRPGVPVRVEPLPRGIQRVRRILETA